MLAQVHQIEAPAAEHTSANFTRDVKKFGLFVNGKPLQDIQAADIQQWISALKKTEAAKTVSQRRSALINYFRWLEQTQVLVANPAQTIPYLKVSAPLPDILYEHECRERRAYLLLLLLLEIGLKKAELFGLKPIHFDVSDAYAPELWVKHTGKQVWKDRKLKLPPEIAPMLAYYVQQYAITDRTDNLFPYTPRFIGQLLTATARQAGVHKPVTASMLRDTFAVRSCKQGAQIEDVLRKLGLTDKDWDDARRKYLQLAEAGM